MSNALVLASVTAILKNLLENGLVDRGITTSLGSEATVSALPPDRVATGADEKAQLNLFLYQVVPKGLSSQSRHAQADRPPGVPRTMELSYLLTAYGAQDFQIEILLGYAMALFSETTVLTQDAIRTVLTSLSSAKGGRMVQPVLATLAAPQLAARIGPIKICPQAMDPEEMSKLWATLQTRYRLSAAYKVAVVIQNERDGTVA